MHASKGLQAPIVYLPDTTRVPRDLDRLLAGDGDIRLWLPRSDDATEAGSCLARRVAPARAGGANRLLYVAMTRAEDRLYVGGWIGSKPQDGGCWYDRIAAGLAASVEGETVEARVRATRKVFDFSRELADLGWSGDGFELVNEGRIEVPEQRGLAARHRGPARSLGRPTRPCGARSADTACPLQRHVLPAPTSLRLRIAEGWRQM